MDRRSMLGGCVGAVLGGIGFRGAAAAQNEIRDAIGSCDRCYAISGMHSHTVLTPEGKRLALWVLGLHAIPSGRGKNGIITDWMRMIPMDDAKCVVFSEATEDGGCLYFIGMQDNETRDFVDIPLVADRWSWESGRRDRFLLGTNPDGTPRFLEAYHLRPDEQVEDVLDMVFLPQMCVAHSNRNRAKYEVIT